MGSLRGGLVLVVSLALVTAGCIDLIPGDDEAPDDPTPTDDTGDSSPDGPGGGSGSGPSSGVYAPGWPPVEEATIRPGAKIVEGTLSSSCTANFVFSSLDNRTLYLGTASHCVPGLAIGDEVSLVGGAYTGTLVYCSWGAIDGETTCTDKSGTGGAGQASGGYANDFALVELPADARNDTHPALVHWGGPTALAQPPSAGAHVLTYGNTDLRDAGQPSIGPVDAREGYVHQVGNWTTNVTLVPASVSGDSGSPVIQASGAAVGVVQTVGVGTDGVSNGVVNLLPAMVSVYQKSDLRIQLKTFHLLESPSLPGESPFPPSDDETLGSATG